MTTREVLTTASTITCGHPEPGAGGAVTLTPQQDVLTIDGESALIGSLVGAIIESTGCSQKNTQGGEVPCSVVLSQSERLSSVLKVNGVPVLLIGTSGGTNGQPNNDWSATDAKQSVLKAD